MNKAEKLQFLLNMLKKKETHECEKCDHTHEVETGFLSDDEINKLINEE